MVYHLNSSYPTDWKISRVVPLRKDGNSCQLNNFRPISMIPIFSKIVEHIMKDQVMRYINGRNLLHANQSGFRQNHSTTTLLTGLTDSIRRKLNEKKNCVLVSLDLSKAFDKVVHSWLIKKLCDMFCFSESACKLVYSYLWKRSQFVSVEGSDSLTCQVTSGVPQGSVIGPILFMIYLNDFLSIMDNNVSETFVYADDVQILFSAEKQFLDVLEVNIDYYLNQIGQWMGINGLDINSSKTKAMCFGFNSMELNLPVNSIGLNFVSEMKCLGIFIDNQLRFSKHIDYVCARVNNTIRRLWSLDLYLPLYMRKRVANALLMSHLLYAMEVFTGTNSTLLRRINLTVNRIIRYVFKLRIREHVSDYVLNFLGFSFDNFIKLRILLMFYKVIRNNCPKYIVANFEFSRSRRNQQIITHHISSSIYERSFHVRLTRVWNLLPKQLKVFVVSCSTFKRRLEQHFEE